MTVLFLGVLSIEKKTELSPELYLLKCPNLQDFEKIVLLLTLIRMGGGKKQLCTSFPPVTSTNIEISPQNFLTFSFNPLPHLCKF